MKKIFAAILLIPALSWALPTKPSGFVTDEAGILRGTSASIDSRLRVYEKATSNEIAVVIVDSLNETPIEEYANDLFKRWGIGKRGKDNGVLILVAVRDRKMRIEVGYGLEPYLTDAFCGSVIRERMTPAFRNGDFAGGISGAISAIQQKLNGGSR